MTTTAKIDCFAYKNNLDNGCSCLKKLYCRNGIKCKFYKTSRETSLTDPQEIALEDKIKEVEK